MEVRMSDAVVVVLLGRYGTGVVCMYCIVCTVRPTKESVKSTTETWPPAPSSFSTSLRRPQFRFSLGSDVQDVQDIQYIQDVQYM